MKSDFEKEEIRNKLQLVNAKKTEIQLIERDSMILQANYLSEIERISKEEGVNRKELAYKIKTSPSYLTQVFRGDKPLNFLTIAKIKRALNLQFEVTASLKSEKKIEFVIGSTEFSLNNASQFTNINSSFGEGYSDLNQRSIQFDLSLFNKFIPKNNTELV